jgi:hypothetical protein
MSRSRSWVHHFLEHLLDGGGKALTLSAPTLSAPRMAAPRRARAPPHPPSSASPLVLLSSAAAARGVTGQSPGVRRRPPKSSVRSAAMASAPVASTGGATAWQRLGIGMAMMDGGVRWWRAGRSDLGPMGLDGPHPALPPRHLRLR